LAYTMMPNNYFGPMFRLTGRLSFIGSPDFGPETPSPKAVEPVEHLPLDAA